MSYTAKRPWHLTEDGEVAELKREMERRGLNSAALAKLAGLSQGTVQNILSGTNRSRKSRRKVNEALGTPIFGGIEQENR